MRYVPSRSKRFQLVIFFLLKKECIHPTAENHNIIERNIFAQETCRMCSYLVTSFSTNDPSQQFTKMTVLVGLVLYYPTRGNSRNIRRDNSKICRCSTLKKNIHKLSVSREKFDIKYISTIRCMKVVTKQSSRERNNLRFKRNRTKGDV